MAAGSGHDFGKYLGMEVLFNSQRISETVFKIQSLRACVLLGFLDFSRIHCTGLFTSTRTITDVTGKSVPRPGLARLHTDNSCLTS